MAATILGSLGAAAIGIVALSAAWDVIGLPRFALAEDVEALRQFSTETRVMLLEDQLWDAQRALSSAQRQSEDYRADSKSPPKWLREDVLLLKRTITKRQTSIEQLR
jgi:hypothetical protein